MEASGAPWRPEATGRRSLLSQEKFEKLVKIVEERSKQMRAVTLKEYKQLIVQLMKEDRVERGFNDVGEVKISNRSTETISAQINAIQYKGEARPRARVQAFNDIKNPISLCCMLNFLQNQVVRENLYSVDDVSLLLNKWSENNTDIIITKEALKNLEKMNISAGAEETTQKQRVVTFNCTISGDNKLISTCIKFKDKNFVNYKLKPFIKKLQEGLFVALYHPSLKDEVLTAEIYKCTIIPEVVKKREEYLTEFAPANNVEGYKAQFKYITILQDGAYGQVSAIEKQLHKYCEENTFNILFAKWSAGCSMVQSPNDCGMMHRNLKSFFKSRSYKARDFYQESNLGSWCDLKIFLKNNISGDSFQTLWKCLTYTSKYLSKAFNEFVIAEGFNQMGLFREDRFFDASAILGRNPQFNNLAQDDATWLIESLPTFYEDFNTNKFVREDSFEKLKENQNIKIPVKKNGMHLNEMSTGRQRCILFGANNLTEIANQMKESRKRKKVNTKTNKNTKRLICRTCVICFERSSATSNWCKCSVSRCTLWRCSKENCIRVFKASHEINHIAEPNAPEEQKENEVNEEDEENEDENDNENVNEEEEG